MKKIFLLLTGILFSPFSNGYEVKKMCVSNNTSSYFVDVILTNGNDLGHKTNCLTCYEPLTAYAVVFWSKDQATIINLRSSLIGLYNTGYDQNGRYWEVTNSPVCQLPQLPQLPRLPIGIQ